MSQVCFFCSKPLNESENIVFDHGMKTLIDSCVERNVGVLENLKDKQSVTIYEQSRKLYIRNSSFAAGKNSTRWKKVVYLR